jgi:hypothetical protein
MRDLAARPEMEGWKEQVSVKPHRWIMTVVYGLSEDGARGAYRGAQVLLDRENLLSIDGPGCLDCEEMWVAVHHKPCPAPSYDLGPKPRNVTYR